MKARGAALLGVAWLLGCPNASPSSDASPQGASAPTQATSSAEAGSEDGVPKIAAAQPVHEFGAIKATESIEHVFTITNEGTADLKIERVQKT